MEEAIQQAKEQNIHRDVFKTQVMKLMQTKSKYRLRGEAGDIAFSQDLFDVLAQIDIIWDGIVPEEIKH